MSMERWNPFRELVTMRRMMDRLFDDRSPEGISWLSGPDQNMAVAVDLNETEKGYEVTASLPGVQPEDIEITINRDTLAIAGKTQQSAERKEGNFLYRERQAGSFRRVITLPEPINTEQVEATMDQGVLKVILPRLQQAQKRRVQVSSGTPGSQSTTTTQTSGTANSQAATTTQTSGTANSQAATPNSQNGGAGTTNNQAATASK